MNHLEIPERNLNLYMPENLAECDRRQYTEISDLIYKHNLGQITYEDFKIHAVYRLLNMKRSTKVLNETQRLHKSSNIYQLAALTEGFFESSEDGESKIIVQDYINNHIPFVNPVTKKYHGPSDGFKNITFGEYTDALNLLLEYEKHKEADYLYLIAAILYRKNKAFSWLRKKNNRRSVYDENDIEARAKLFQLLHPGEIYGIYLFLSSFHKYLTNATIYMAGNEINLSVLFNGGSNQAKSKLPGIGFKSLEYMISESGVFGSSEKVRQTNLWEVLIRLYDMTKSDKDEEARIKSLKSKSK